MTAKYRDEISPTKCCGIQNCSLQLTLLLFLTFFSFFPRVLKVALGLLGRLDNVTEMSAVMEARTGVTDFSE